MAIYYVWSGATGTGTGASWANAKTTIGAMLTGSIAGDLLYVAHDHAEILAVNSTLASPGSINSPNRIVCVNRAGSVPPVSADRRATASVTTTGSSSLSLNGHAHYDGIIFSATDAAGTGNLNIPSSGTSPWLRFDNCSLRIGGTSGSNRIVLGGASACIELNNTTMSFAAGAISADNVVRWRNTPSALLGTVPSTLFVPSNGRTGNVEIVGVDLSAAGSGKTLVGSNLAAFIQTFRFIDCKLDAAVTKVSGPSSWGTGEIDFIRSGASGVNYTVSRHRVSGTLTEETTIVRSGGAGASDGTTPIAWKIATSSNCTYSMPFECPPIAIWNDTTGSAVTATVEGVWGGATPLDTECWVEVEYLGDASSPLGFFVADCAPDLLTAGVNQTSSSETWGGSGYATFDGTPALGAVVSNGNLTVTHGSTSSNAGVFSTSSKTSGKYYFEMTLQVSLNNSNYIGIGSGTLVDIGSTINCTAINTGTSTTIYSNDVTTGKNLGASAISDVFGFAIDLTGRLAWIRRGAGSWNADPTADPATGTNGVVIEAGTFAPAVRFSNGLATNAFTANFGASAFTGAVPVGFTAGWPAYSPFKLNVSFTAQQKGWIYARVKCAKASSTFYIDPLVTLA